MSERKFWNSELLLYFSTTSGNSASNTQQRNTIPVRKEVFMSFSFKSITVHETVTSLINVEIFSNRVSLSYFTSTHFKK